jgi:hypothetical protein
MKYFVLSNGVSHKLMLNKKSLQPYSPDQYLSIHPIFISKLLLDHKLWSFKDFLTPKRMPTVEMVCKLVVRPWWWCVGVLVVRFGQTQKVI